jgi:hypothetical protein
MSGWKDSEGEVENRRKKCLYGKGDIVEYETYTEESDYPPFYRGGHTYWRAECPKNCEKINNCEERKKYNR